jgi:hypothetical protein
MLSLPIDFYSSTSGTTYFESLGSGWRLMDEGDGEERGTPNGRTVEGVIGVDRRAVDGPGFRSWVVAAGQLHVL